MLMMIVQNTKEQQLHVYYTKEVKERISVSLRVQLSQIVRKKFAH